MDFGETLTIWLARVSAMLYVLALVLMVWHSELKARVVWSAALLVYLAHVVGAFQTFYQWSHPVAYRETARQTEALFGVSSGVGLYLNYLFTLVWTADCTWWWIRPQSYRTRSPVVTWAAHGFLAFMFVNATLVVWLLRAVRNGR